MEQFEAYFRRADVDQDGKISGSEAVNFLQGSNLPKNVLAQIWMHADKSHTGFLSREEFYNALKLVTVAQRKHELTPDIVKAALFGAAAAKIPPPQINLAAISAPQSTSAGAAPAPAPQMGAVGQAGSQNYGFRGQAPPNTNMNQQYFPGQNNQLMRPSLPIPAGAGTAPRPQLGFSNSNVPRGGSMAGPGNQNSNMSNDWLGGRTGGAPVTATMPTSARGTSSPMPHVASNPLDSLSRTSATAANDPRALGGYGGRPALDSSFGGDFFSATQSTPKQASTVPSNFANSTPSSAIAPASTVSPPTSTPDPFEVLQSTYTRKPLGSQQQQTQSLPKPNQQVSAPVSMPTQQSGIPATATTSTSYQSESPWPKMTRTGVQKYAKVFMEVDTDRDGRITGEQARNLFLSWRLPREVLKQVWDLSDQDSDSMLSLREFCISLYLMERYREGRALPPSLPSSVMLDETLLSMAGPPASGYGTVGWGTAPGVRPPQPGNQQTHYGARPPIPAGQHQGDRALHFNQQSTRSSPNESTQVNQHSNGQQTPTAQETVDKENEGESNDKMILDSKEKLEYYRSKMQDLVLYKSRCDNRLNEITERALADKREAEMLGKKYEEKYKQVAEIASKLTIEEASFREIQGRKTELEQAMIKMEQGGSADGILQVRADRIQSDIEELLKALAERCKKHKVDLKSAAIIELPPGWQPGIPEVAAVWDEDWDKFEDEGFSFDVAISANTKAQSPQSESSPNHSDAEANSESTFNKASDVIEADSPFMHSDDESKSPQASPKRQLDAESPPQGYSDNHFRSSFDADAETHRSFDDSTWGTFDNNDDIDSVWGFNVKDPDHDKDDEKYFFDSKNSVSSPKRRDSPGAGDYPKSSSFFEDSVPGSPQSRAGNSPRYSVGSVDPFFDGFSRFDSFRTNDHPSSPRKETFTRFDSINSSRGFDFEDSDPFGSSGPFKVSSESQNSMKDSNSWNSS
ncbi:membrane traffic protein [Lithospermum erythrorhizon]|uniref:Membrane traffic protein n=1 Tax=Lithospermum erythrorhizon TaxID=34254 RepID=A0AAV3QEW0_LITER